MKENSIVIRIKSVIIVVRKQGQQPDVPICVNLKMTPSYYTKKTFEKIKSSRKKYISFIGAHFPTDKPTYLNGEKV